MQRILHIPGKGGETKELFCQPADYAMQQNSNLCSCCIRFRPQCSVCARNQAVTYKRCRSVCRVVRELITTVKAIQYIGIRLFHVIAGQFQRPFDHGHHIFARDLSARVASIIPNAADNPTRLGNRKLFCEIITRLHIGK